MQCRLVEVLHPPSFVPIAIGIPQLSAAISRPAGLKEDLQCCYVGSIPLGGL